MRRATSRQAAMVSSEVCGVRTSSMTFIFGTGLKKRMPIHRSRETVMSVKSVIEREEVLLAKIAPALPNLSKIVKSSIFISSSSGTVLKPPNAAAYAIPRPIVPAPITAMVLTSMPGSPLEGTSLRKFPVTLFIKTEQDLRAVDDHGPADKIWLLGHELDGF